MLIGTTDATDGTSGNECPRSSRRTSPRKKSAHHRASATTNPSKKAGPGRRADRQAFIIVNPPHCKAGSSNSSWVPRRRAGNKPTMGINTFLARLSASISSSDGASQLSDAQALLQSGDGGDGFLDDSLPSLVHRCRRMKAGKSCVDLLLMVHLMQLVCKCTRSAEKNTRFLNT